MSRLGPTIVGVTNPPIRSDALQYKTSALLRSSIDLPRIFESDNPKLIYGFVSHVKLFKSVDDKFLSLFRVQQADIDAPLELGLLEPIAASPIELSPSPAAAQAAPGERLPQERYAEGYTIATELTGKLGLKGFHLNLAVEATTCYDDLVAVAPRIRDAVGLERYAPLEHALFG